MKITTWEEYTKAKKEFIKKHSKIADWKVETSSLNEYNIYHKEYVFEDGAVFYERMAPVWKKAGAEVEVVHGVHVWIEQEVKLLEIEYYRTDNTESCVYYERY